MPRKKKAAAKSKGTMSASDFVRSQPRSMTALQVVDAGAKQGLKFSGNLVYAVRAADKKKAGAGKKQMGAAGARSSSDAAFRQLVVDLGLQRARALVNEVEGALAKVIRGG